MELCLFMCHLKKIKESWCNIFAILFNKFLCWVLYEIWVLLKMSIVSFKNCRKIEVKIFAREKYFSCKLQKYFNAIISACALIMEFVVIRF